MPSDPVLQGAKGSSRSSSDFSSSEGVWLVRKWKENERKGRKGEAAGKLPPTVSLLPKVKSPITMFAWALNAAPKTIQIPKKQK